MQLDAMLPDDAIAVNWYQPHLAWVARVLNEIYRLSHKWWLSWSCMKRACLHTCPRTFHFQIPVGKHGLLCHFRSLNWHGHLDGLRESVALWQLAESS